MIFSHQTRGAMAQVLSTVSTEAAKTFLYKHLGISEMYSFVLILAEAPPDPLRAMLNELLVHNKILYAAAPVKHVFNSGIEELERWALHDGWIVDDGALVRVTPAAEEATGIRDKFLQDLATTILDSDGAIRNAVESASKNFVSQPPDFNGSITNVRITLETVARRAAIVIEGRPSGVYPEYSEYKWGKALQLLRTTGVIELQEEEILARVYTFISPGAHVPKGVTAEEWARLARTFGLSSAYFLLRKYAAF